MHDLYMDPTALKMEPSYAIHHDSVYMSGEVDMAATHDRSPHQSPGPGYSSSFEFTLPAPTHYDHPFSAAPYQSHHPAPTTLQPLNTSTLWPSQLTNPSPPSSSSASASMPLQHRPIAPVTQESPREPTSPPTPPPTAKPAAAFSNSRKTLTDKDRRRMCQYHEENPTVKQTEIGAMFGVERSTVSKVLRNKDKFLAAEDGRRSPTNKSKTKSKFPDIERTLINWAKNRLNDGQPIDDDMIKEEARKFAATLGSTECASHVNDPVWLDKFKQRNGLVESKGKPEKARRESLSPHDSRASSAISPTVDWNGTPISAIKEEGKNKSPASMFDEANPWSHTHTQSATSLGSLISDVGFSSDFRSPTSPSFFTPLSSSGPSPAMPAHKMPRLPTLAPAKLHRRSTVPMVGGDDESPQSATSKNGGQGLPPMELHHDEMDISPIGIDTSMAHSRPSTTIPTSHLNSASSASNHSPFSMYPPSTTTLSTNLSPIIGSTASPSSPPSQDEARAALETLRKYMEHQPNGTIDPHDYLVMGKWMQMLKLEGQGLPGGMYSIAMSERADGTTPIGRKRSEHSLN